MYWRKNVYFACNVRRKLKFHVNSACLLTVEFRVARSPKMAAAGGRETLCNKKHENQGLNQENEVLE